MLQALERYFPEKIRLTVPTGGLFLWVQLPDDFPIGTIRKETFAQNIYLACGSAFFPDKQGYRAMRLTFCLSSEEIEQGISIVGKLLKKYIFRGCVVAQRSLSTGSQRSVSDRAALASVRKSQDTGFGKKSACNLHQLKNGMRSLP
ncbi:MAG: hypothetical protein V7K21_13830 [Nostoc sp.]|uniref:hypothetical protein n=1 Tax=Nostoc sp. TaxID=1180 RepID=UPI002FF4F275